ncbi:forkhead box protein N2 isoform X1 [Bombina bombina]|uniref:forkhead box protein N2 isoform X1 n=2 Tax=Bombina bombina TaxID=8345 RepID=UPI00235AAF25|nr:forkhead box protein N2 isoform X1 [Bombina bombina]
MGPVTGMTPDKNIETPGSEKVTGLIHIDTMGSLPEEVGAARPKASAVDCGPADEELTNLNWLHESTNLLNNFSLGSEGLAPGGSLYDIEGDNSSGCQNTDKSSTSTKPPYSFSLLIYMAIEHSPNKCLPVKEIYSWILDRFPYFATAPTGWKNSVRHNLSLNKCFRKVERSHGKVNGKGSLWCVDPEYKPNLIQALKKQPFSAALTLYTPPASPTGASSPPHFLSSMLKQNHGSSAKDSDIDAATAMMLLNSSIKQEALDCVCCNIRENVKLEVIDGQKPQPLKVVLPKKRSYASAFKHHASLSLQENDSAVINIDPKEDHNYSASGTDSQRCDSRSSVSSLSSVDEVYEFIPKNSRAGSDGSEGFHSEDDTDIDCEDNTLGDSGYTSQPCEDTSSKDLQIKKQRKEACQDIDDELKEAAGSLLHLAGIRTCLDSLLKTAKAHSQKHRK